MDDDMNKTNVSEEHMVDQAFDYLAQTYLATKHRKKIGVITKAFNFARHAHQGVKRLSGEPYIMHPLAVAQIVCSEIGLGSTSICAALLHDVVEDTDYTVEDIENIFGPKVAQIVDGLTKISGGIFGDNASAQAENFKKLLLCMSEDIRVILIKIADRLHNMRTLGSQPKNKQYKIAGETLYIYAPLANRLGLNTIKTELEDLSFRYEHPADYEYIQQELANSEVERSTVFEEFTAPIRERLSAMGVDYTIKARVKSPYSIWRKMQTKHVPFKEVYDILAVRIIYKPKNPATELNECWNIYVALCDIYRSHPDRIRDWITHPKANGYQALHVTLMSTGGEWIEVQIRSERMDEIAEKGFAAHWKYKEGDKTESASERELDKWLTTIKEILDDPQPNAMDFLDTIKLNLFSSEIFVFTPKGDIKTMPTGSTVLDFAFMIHTFVGSHCIGAKVNHKLVPMSHKLQSGDQVEVLTSKNQHVEREWLSMVTTAKATTKIMAVLRREEREAMKHGEDLLDAFFAQHDLVKDSVKVEKLVKYHRYDKLEQLLAAIGNGKIELGESDLDILAGRVASQGPSWKRFFGFRTKNKKAEPEDKKTYLKVDSNFNRKQVLQITESDLQTKYALAGCCNPIPGDSVLGYIDDDNHIVIHKVTCPVASRLKTSHGNRIVAAEWAEDQKRTVTYPVDIYIKGLDHVGLLNQITGVISQQQNLNMHKLSVECNDGIFECTIQLLVHDTHEVDQLINHIRLISGLTNVARV